MLTIGIDTGGTFTDFVVFENGKIKSFKILSTPKNPEKTILDGLKHYLKKDFLLIHGTTVATNTFLENKMTKTAFITTKGFEDILKIGRQNRVNLFSLNPQKPSQIIKDNMIFGLNERILFDGKVLKEVEDKEISEIAKKIKERKAKAIAILFLHSYKNSKNEKRVKDILKNEGFDFITISSEIFPEYREYERGIITVLNSSLMPIVSNYINKIQEGLKGKKFYIIQSNGGVLSPEKIKIEPVRTLLSGPSGGLIAAKLIADISGEKNLITLDMGGTSTDVSLIKDGNLILSKDREMNHLKIKIPMIEIETVGAGGGSIAKVDRAGVLQVGPESAGADPGPACYGKSELPTITDAFVVLNIIDPDYFLGGKMKIHPERSFKAIKKIADKLRKTVYETAEGIIKISVSSIERALRRITVEKGEDPRFFTLLPFGGAGGLIASFLAERLDIRKILIPDNQGVFSALGMIFSKFQKEFSLPILKMQSEETEFFIKNEFKKLEKKAFNILKDENIPEEKSEILKYVEMRYRGQSYELSIPFDKNYITNFHREHRKLYSYSLKDEDIEIVNIRLIAVGKISEAKFNPKIEKKRNIESQVKKIYYNGKFTKFNYYKREELYPEAKLKTPAILISEFSTLVVPPSFSLEIDEFSNILMVKND